MMKRRMQVLICILIIFLVGCGGNNEQNSVLIDRTESEKTETIAIQNLEENIHDEGQFNPDNIDNQNYLDAIKFWNNRDYDAAEFKFLEALKETPTIEVNDSLNAAYIEMKLGMLYTDVGRYNDALDKLISSYTTFRTHLGYNNNFTVISLVNISDCDIYKERFDLALASLMEAYKYLTEKEAKWKVAQKIAYIYDRIGEYDDAQEWYDRAFSMSQNNYEPIDVGALYNGYGIHLRGMGRYSDAIAAFEKAADLVVNSASNENLEDLVIIYMHLYGLYRMENRIEDATILIDKTQKKIEEEGKNDIIKALCYMRVAEELSDDDEQYMKYSSLALGIIENTVGINSNLGVEYFSDKGHYYIKKAYYDTTLFENALECYEQAVSIERNILAMHTLSAAHLYQNAAFACLNLGYYEKCLEYTEESIRIKKELTGEDTYEMVSAFANKANVCLKMQLLEEAKDSIKKALELYERHKNDEYTDGAIYAHTCDIAGAVFSYRPEDMSPSEFGLTTEYNNAIYYYMEAEKMYYKAYLETGEEQVGYNAMGTLFDCAYAMIEGNNIEDAKKILNEVSEMGRTIIKPDSQLRDDYIDKFSKILVILYDAEGTDIPKEEWFMQWYES